MLASPGHGRRPSTLSGTHIPLSESPSLEDELFVMFQGFSASALLTLGPSSALWGAPILGLYPLMPGATPTQCDNQNSL